MTTNQPNQPQGMPDFLYANNPFDRKDIGVWDAVSKDTAIKYVRADTLHQEALDALKEANDKLLTFATLRNDLQSQLTSTTQLLERMVSALRDIHFALGFPISEKTNPSFETCCECDKLADEALTSYEQHIAKGK